MRTVLEIRQEYTNVCAEAGHLQHTIHGFGKSISALEDKLRQVFSKLETLGTEGEAATKAEDAAKGAGNA